MTNAVATLSTHAIRRRLAATREGKRNMMTMWRLRRCKEALEDGK
jgi:hypothetical protein